MPPRWPAGTWASRLTARTRRAGTSFEASRAWQQVHLNALVSLQAGWHTVRTRNHRVTWGENVYFICHSDGKENYPGRTLEVWDRGVNVG